MSGLYIHTPYTMPQKPSRMLKSYGLFAVLLTVALSLYGQEEGPGMFMPGERPDVRREIFLRKLPAYQAQKVQGRTYFNPYPGIEHHQFFRTRGFSQALICLHADTLFCEFVRYDIFRDKLITFSGHASVFVELEEELISSFELFVPGEKRSCEFINSRLTFDFPRELPQGFYQVVYEDSGLTILKKHEKMFTQVPRNNVYIPVFAEKELLILKKDGNYYPLQGKKDLLRIYPGYEKQIRRHLRTTQNNMKVTGEGQLRAMGDFINGLPE